MLVLKYMIFCADILKGSDFAGQSELGIHERILTHRSIIQIYQRTDNFQNVLKRFSMRFDQNIIFVATHF